MYNSSLVVAIKVGGQILRENGDTVTLPFGSEYSVLIKNLNTVRIQAEVSVDGTDATGGTRLVIHPNSSLELERFISNGNLQIGNRLKFIERTAAVEQHLGIGAEDGLVRVQAWREFVQPYVPYNPPLFNQTQWGNRRHPRFMDTPRASGSSLRGAGFGEETAQNVGANTTFTNSVSTAGVTVPGSQSNQVFTSIAGFPLEQQSVMVVLRLLGCIGAIPVTQPVTVKTKATCESCGLQSEAANQFCGRCGTSLVLF